MTYPLLDRIGCAAAGFNAAAALMAWWNEDRYLALVFGCFAIVSWLASFRGKP